VDIETADEMEMSDITLGHIIQQQLKIMSKQLDVFNNRLLPSRESRASKSNSHLPINQVNEPKDARFSQATDPKRDSLSPISPYQPIDKRHSEGLSDLQNRHLKTLIEDYTNRTKGSKRLAQTYRRVLADNRKSAGFRFSIKEMLYPIAAEANFRS